jgi:Domain of unknown function (DUF4062)
MAGPLQDPKGSLPAAGEPSKKAGVSVFISSVFKDPWGIYWPLRRKLADCLREHCHYPWRFEDDPGRRNLPAEGQRQVILQGLRQSDLVIVLYRTRAGSILTGEAFRATNFEFLRAVQLRKPTYLYLLGEESERDFFLQHTLAVITDPVLALPERIVAVYEGKDEEVANRIREDVDAFRSSGRVACVDSAIAGSIVQPEAVCLEITALTGKENIREALQLVNRTIRPSGGQLSDPRETYSYARLLREAASVWANAGYYDSAVWGSKQSARLFAKLGADREFCFQVQCTSGILQMSGRVSEAWHWNVYGRQQAVRKFRDLLPSFYDSGGSIMAQSGNWRAAIRQLQISLETIQRLEGTAPSAYQISKHAAGSYRAAELGILPNAQKKEALQRLEREALPMALKSKRSLAYTLRHAAALAIMQGDYDAAECYIRAGIEDCLEKGLYHTLSNLEKLRSVCTLSRKGQFGISKQVFLGGW